MPSKRKPSVGRDGGSRGGSGSALSIEPQAQSADADQFSPGDTVCRMTSGGASVGEIKSVDGEYCFVFDQWLHRSILEIVVGIPSLRRSVR